jgi:hypothetical protein
MYKNTDILNVCRTALETAVSPINRVLYGRCATGAAQRLATQHVTQVDVVLH